MRKRNKVKRIWAALAALFLCLEMVFSPTMSVPVSAATEDEIMLLTYLIHAEAGNQDMTGKKLVADVVLNRLYDPRFPDTISEVIYQPYQFSPVKDGNLDKARSNWTQEDYDAAVCELCDQVDYDIIFFCAGGYSEYGTPAYQYGDHYFSR